jgi:hypothetical protein
MQFNPVTNSYGANSSNDVIASDAMREYQEAIEREEAEAEAERKRQLEAQRAGVTKPRTYSFFGGKRRSRRSRRSKKSRKSKQSRRR